MNIENIQALIAQGLLTDAASLDLNTTYVTVGVYQPGNRQNGPSGNAYPSYVLPLSQLAGSTYTASNGIVLIGNDFQLATPPTPDVWVAGSGFESIQAITSTPTSALGAWSLAWGNNCIANSNYSFVGGQTCVTNNQWNFAMGRGCTTSSDFATAIGRDNIASGPSSMSIGRSNLASNSSAFSGGFSCTASGDCSSVQGRFSTASGFVSRATGQSCIASGTYAFVHGNTSQATNTCTIVLGDSIIGTAANTTYVDNFNVKAKVNALGLPVGFAAVGLVSGDMYLDTAANILAAGDYVVGWKV